MDAVDFENKKLKETIKLVKELLQDEKNNLEKMYRDFYGDKEEFKRLVQMKKLHISNLEVSADKPYFARIDFVSDDDGKVSTIYIGKNGVMKDTQVVVTDWRAPISSLYYDAEIGRCSFEAPMGVVTGHMDLKRQYEIEKGRLIDYFDVDLVSNDTLLQKYLNGNNDARLKSIVSTIQKEQNEVIRKRISDNLIIQGVAGSGKTTVALHRIAYLVYNYMKSIKQSQYLVIGPNPVFLKYIKSVLPELDVEGVHQCTFEQFAKDYIDEDIEISSSDKKVIANISGASLTDIDKFKSSIKYKKMLDEFLKVYFCSLTSSDLMLDDFKVLSQKKIQEVFNSTSNFRDLKSRVSMSIERLCRVIENEKDSILSDYINYSHDIFKSATDDDEKERLRRKFAKDRSELEKNCRNIIRKYFAKSKVNATKLYKIFINSVMDFDIYNYQSLEELKKNTLRNIRVSKYDFEDLPALMYIKSKVSVSGDNYDSVRHTVIDEAQDLGEFNFWILKKCLPSSTFSIFGDLAQSIYDYRSVSNWDEVNNVMFNSEGQVINFNKSYRTTAEIMEVADEVACSIGLGKSDLVVRHGESVKFTSVDGNDDIPDYIVSKVEEYKEKGYRTIAIISKTNLLSNYINEDLADRGLVVPNVTFDDDLSDDKFSTCTISNQLAKGLEFDAIIINGASESLYSSSNSLDMKLLYVAITRALHEVDIVYSGELTKPLSDFVKQNNAGTVSKILKK